MTKPDYLSGFGNELESEALPGALPRGRFSPQHVPMGLYAEKFSNTAFTAPRADNRRTWLYRIRPSVVTATFEPCQAAGWLSAPCVEPATPPEPLRWDPPELDDTGDFVDGLRTVAVNGDVHRQCGIGIHLFAASKSMPARSLVNADGEMLIVPRSGRVQVRTECGLLESSPGEVVLIPRGMRFAVDAVGTVSGYVCENYGANLRLPERGLVGSDGFANTRDFMAPTAAFHDVEAAHESLCRYGGRLYRAALAHDPFDVVAWAGNALPYKYDLQRFNVLGSISYDHPDPSIFTVLSSPSDTVGVANLDFVIFPPRWLVAEDTFRPPWYHRNVMSEFMGLILGQYDARKRGFEPGAMTLHNSFVPHGPDAEVHAAASEASLEPQKLEDTLAFMFETRYPLNVTPWARELPELQKHYRDCWSGLDRRFTPPA